jgi:hypothetical protein
MKRYESTQVTNRFDGKRVYRTTQYPNILPDDTDLIITTCETDYLDTLAFKYYNDPTLWWVIALANNIGKGRMSVEAGLQLRIPTKINDIVSKFIQLN